MKYLFFFFLILASCNTQSDVIEVDNTNTFISSACDETIILPSLITEDTIITAINIIVDSTVIEGANVIINVQNQVMLQNHLSIDDSSSFNVNQVICD